MNSRRITTTQAPLTSEEIAQRAYLLWEQEGCPEGRSLEHWLRAERRLREEREGRGRIGQRARGVPATDPEQDWAEANEVQRALEDGIEAPPAQPRSSTSL